MTNIGRNDPRAAAGDGTLASITGLLLPRVTRYQKEKATPQAGR